MKFSGFYELLKYAKEHYSDNIALKYAGKSGIETLTYSNLSESVFKRSEEFKSLPCCTVGIFDITSVQLIIDIFASVIAGKRTVMLNAAQPIEKLSEIIESFSIDYLCTYNNDFKELEKSIQKNINKSNSSNNDGEGELLFFTSGTTDSSRAVVLDSKSLCFSAWNGNEMLPCYDTDTILSMLPLSHVFGFVCTFLWPFTQGAAIALGRGLQKIVEDPKFFEPTIIPVVPSMIKFLIAMKALNKSLRVILVGASPCDKETLEAVKAMGISISFGYGLTETASGLAISVNSENPLEMKLCPDTKIKIAEDSEILISTPCMMKGYYNDPLATKIVLKNGWLYTGDLGYIDSSNSLIITGRKKDILILDNGTKIFCNEWENELMKLLDVKELSLIQLSNSIVLVAVDNPDNYNKIWEKVEQFNETRQFGQSISNLIVQAEPLPRTATGKIKRWAITEKINNKKETAN